MGRTVRACRTARWPEDRPGSTSGSGASRALPDRDAALAAATETPARLLGLDDGRGTLRVGGRADIVLLTGDLDVAATIVGGRVAFRSPGAAAPGPAPA